RAGSPALRAGTAARAHAGDPRPRLSRRTTVPVRRIGRGDCAPGAERDAARPHAAGRRRPRVHTERRGPGARPAARRPQAGGGSRMGGGMTTVLTGATIVLPDRLLESGTLVIEDGRIAEVREGTV